MPPPWGLLSSVQLPSQSCPHLEPPPHLEDPSHSPSAGVTCNQRPLPLQLPKSREGIVLPSPIPRASLTLSPCRVISLLLCPGSARHQPSTPIGTSSPEGLLRSKTPPLPFYVLILTPCVRFCLLLGVPFPIQRQRRRGGRSQGLGEGHPGPAWAGGPLRCGALPG